MTEQKKYYLLPSQIFASSEDYKITTVLGSCVAICLWDKVNKIGGMNHYMLPHWNGNGLASPKYGSIAIEKLIKKMLEQGSSLKYLEAKVFGGGEVLGTESTMFNIGKRNVELAEDVLREFKINIIAKSVGGVNGRKILFCTKTGTVRQKYVNATCVVK